MTRLGTVLLATLALGLTSLVLHTRSLTRSHLEVAHLFEHAEHGGVAAAAGDAFPPPRLGFLEERSQEADARALCDAARRGIASEGAPARVRAPGRTRH